MTGAKSCKAYPQTPWKIRKGSGLFLASGKKGFFFALFFRPVPLKRGRRVFSVFTAGYR
jgi:hypothetical protein